MPQTYNLGQAFFAEVFGTFLLCFVVLCIATTNTTLQQFHGYSVGGVIVAAGCSFGPIPGGLINPAVTLAAAVGNELGIITDPSDFTYMAAQMTGGVIAVAIFRKVTHGQIVLDELQEVSFVYAFVIWISVFSLLFGKFKISDQVGGGSSIEQPLMDNKTV